MTVVIYKSAPFGQCPSTFEMLPRPLSPGQTGKLCCARYLSYLYLSYQCFGMCVTSVGKRRNSVSSNVSEFGRKYFCSPGSNFCFCIKSQCFQIWDAGKIRANIENHELIFETMPVSLAKRL